LIENVVKGTLRKGEFLKISSNAGVMIAFLVKKYLSPLSACVPMVGHALHCFVHKDLVSINRP